jgi:hypothetical protein
MIELSKQVGSQRGESVFKAIRNDLLSRIRVRTYIGSVRRKKQCEWRLDELC